MSDYKFLDKHRVQHPAYPPMPIGSGMCGAFRFNLPGEVRPICCIASDGEGWQHVSVSFGQGSTRAPSWDIMCQVKELFWEPEDAVIQFHPAKSHYVNFHDGCLHLWRCTDGRAQPTPPTHFV